MDYYYSKNNSNTNKNRPYYHNENTPLDSFYSGNLGDKNKKIDTLIIDGNAVYEVDVDCLKNQLNPIKSRKSNVQKNRYSN